MIIDDMYITEEDYTVAPKIDKSGSAAAQNTGAKNKTEIGIVSGDIIDAEMKHRLETLDKEQYQAILESKDIVKAYNDFVDLKIEEYKNKNEDSDTIKIIRTFQSCFNDFYQLNNSLVSGKSVEEIKRDVKDGFTYQSQDPQFIRQLLQTRLRYAETTEKLLKQLIENNAKVLKISSSQLDTMIKGSSPQNIKDMKDQIEKNQDQFIKNQYLADCRSIGAGILVCGFDFEIGGPNTKFKDCIQDLLHYDVVVRSHGQDSTLTERTDPRLRKKVTEALKKSKLLKLSRVTDKDIEGVIADFYAYVAKNQRQPTANDLYKNDKKKQTIYNMFLVQCKKSYKDEVAHARWEFAKPIKFVDGKSYISVVKFVKACKDQGFKKIKMYQCNPGEFDLPEKLKPGVIFTQRTNYIESTLIKDYEVTENPSLDGVYQLEQLALQLCDENNIDYNDDNYLTECMNYYQNFDQEILSEGIISSVFEKLIEICKKVIAAIIGFIKRIVGFIGNLIKKAFEFIKNRDQRKVKKQVKVISVTLEAAKIKTNTVSSQDELYKIIEGNLNSIAKEYRKVADKQARITKQLQQQLEIQSRKAQNESTMKYESGNVFDNIIDDFYDEGSGDMLYDNSIEFVNNVLDESSYLSKLALPLKVKKINKSKGVSINGYADLIKYHYNPGLRQVCQTSKDIDELKYLRDDTRTSIPTLNKIQERMYNCRKLGECKETKSYYKYIKKKYLDRGLTENDVKKTIIETQKTIQICNDRIKELKKAIKESGLVKSCQYADDIINELFKVKMPEEKIGRDRAVYIAVTELKRTLSSNKEYKIIKDNTKIAIDRTQGSTYDLFCSNVVDMANIGIIYTEKIRAKADKLDRPFNTTLKEIVDNADTKLNPVGFRIYLHDHLEYMMIYVKSMPVL